MSSSWFMVTLNSHRTRNPTRGTLNSILHHCSWTYRWCSSNTSPSIRRCLVGSVVPCGQFRSATKNQKLIHMFNSNEKKMNSSSIWTTAPLHRLNLVVMKSSPTSTNVSRSSRSSLVVTPRMLRLDWYLRSQIKSSMCTWPRSCKMHPENSYIFYINPK